MAIETAAKKLKAFKAVNKRGDGKYDCLGSIYEPGQTYTHDSTIDIYSSGFHCCPNASDVYNYYTFGDNTEVFEVVIPKGANVIKDGDKWCVSSIKFPKSPVKDNTFNTGNRNTGHSNTGDWNTGNYNTGDWNTGNYNTGDRNAGHRNTGYSNTGHSNTGSSNTGYSNTGDRNTGYSNTGYSNTGHSNTGNRNTGYSNTGDWNTGDWNTANYQTGFFNTIDQPVSLFNGRVMLPRKEFMNHSGYHALLSVPFKLTKWVENNDLPDSQKVVTPYGGKTQPAGWLEAHNEWWSNMSAGNKALVQTLPGFCPVVFKEVTGIDV